MDRMMLEIKEYSGRMTKIVTQFAQLALLNRDIGTFLIQHKVNPRGRSYPSSFDSNDVMKVSVMISLRLGKKGDT